MYGNYKPPRRTSPRSGASTGTASSSFKTPPRSGASTGSSVAFKMTASTTKAKHQVDRLELSDQQSESLVSEMEMIDAEETAGKKNIYDNFFQSELTKLVDEKSYVVEEIHEGTKRFAKLQEAVADAEEFGDHVHTDNLKEQLKDQKAHLHYKEMRLNVINVHIGAVSAKIDGKGFFVPADKDFVNFGTKRLTEVQGVFDGASFASDIQDYVDAVIEQTGEPKVQVLANILLRLKKGGLASSVEFVEMFGQFSDEAKAVLGRKRNGTRGVLFSPAIRSSKVTTGFESSTDCMIWRIAMYLDLEWDLDDTIISVPLNLRNPFRLEVVNGELLI